MRRGNGLFPLRGGGDDGQGLSYRPGRLPYRPVRHRSGQGDGSTALRDISSAVVRISRQVRGLWQEVPEWSVGGFDSTLIAAPPGGGKTTLLRDMIATLSNGTEDRCPLRVGVVDERGELAGMYRGVPQLDVGCHTDVLDGCPKALGIPMLLRSANPQVIAVDEITEAADILAMTAAANCGVKLLATIHAEDGEELRRKPLFRQLAEAGVFRRLITISTAEGRRHYRTEAL